MFFIITPFKIFPMEVTLLLFFLVNMMLIAIAILAFSGKRIHKKLEKLSKQLKSRCWFLVADTPFPQEYLFDLENGYIYGAFALNPFSIQRVDLRDVEGVEIIYTAHKIVPFKQWTINLTDKVDVENTITHGTESICQWHDRKWEHLPIGHQSELTYRENALRLKKLILDLKKIAQVKRTNQ